MTTIEGLILVLLPIVNITDATAVVAEAVSKAKATRRRKMKNEVHKLLFRFVIPGRMMELLECT